MQMIGSQYSQFELFWRNAGTIWLKWTVIISVVIGIGVLIGVGICIYACVSSRTAVTNKVSTTNQIEMQQHPGTADPSNGDPRGGAAIMPGPAAINPRTIWYAREVLPSQIERETQRQMLAL